MSETYALVIFIILAVISEDYIVLSTSAKQLKDVLVTIEVILKTIRIKQSLQIKQSLFACHYIKLLSSIKLCGI